MQRIVCPDTESWTMVECLISDDVERLGNVQWWSLASQCTSDQLVKTVRCEAVTKECCAVSIYVGRHERSGAAIFLTPDGVKRGTRIARMMEHERWDRVFFATCAGVPWQLRPDQRNLARPVVPAAEAVQGVALVIVMPAVPRVDRRRHVHEARSRKVWIHRRVSSMHTVGSDDRCRERIGELMLEDARQGERVSSREQSQSLTSRAQKPERRWTLVNRRSVWMCHQSNQLPRINTVDLHAQVEQMKSTQTIATRNV